MFGAEAAALVRRGRSGSEVVAATDPSLTPDDLRREGLPRAEADDAHDLVLVGAAVPAGRQRLLAAFAAHAGAILQRRSLQASAGEARRWPATTRPHGAALGRLARPAHTRSRASRRPSAACARPR